MSIAMTLMKKALKHRFLVYIFFSVIVCLNFVKQGYAGNTQSIHIMVKTVLASNESNYMDPRLADLTRDLEQVFRYSSYQLLAQHQMQINMGRTGSCSLPGGRKLNITSIEIVGDRVELRLEILKGSQQLFQTVIELLNNGTITVGGPMHENGYLLFNIFCSF
ncbi:MAG: hypothetical protein HQK77_01855 [Desulfobacterales bacterium]|nr:hypothetical protein [Desulfobacterales bacterium]